jgi:hypothetical protein
MNSKQAANKNAHDSFVIKAPAKKGIPGNQIAINKKDQRMCQLDLP